MFHTCNLRRRSGQFQTTIDNICAQNPSVSATAIHRQSSVSVYDGSRSRHGIIL